MPVKFTYLNKAVPEKTPQPGKRGRGRPPLDPDKAKREPISFRTTRELRDKLDNAADNSGRSLAQEVECRLQQSFVQEQRVQEIRETVHQDIVDHAFGGQSIFDITRVIASGIAALQNRTGKTLSDRKTNEHARHLANQSLKNLISAPGQDQNE